MICAGYPDCTAEQRQNGCAECLSSRLSAHEYQRVHARELERVRLEWLKFEPRRDRATRQHLAVIALLFVCQAIPFVLVWVCR